jgi:transketolase
LIDRPAEYTRVAYGETLIEVGRQNRNIVALDADLSSSTKTSLFGKEFPDRFFQMGISEADMMGTAAGLASCGKLPFVSTFAIFATGRAWEQIRNTIASPNLPVRICPTHGGISVGEDGHSHQSLEDVALMRVIPNMTVMIPADAVETRSMVRYLAGDHNGPVYMRLGRPKFPIVLPDDYTYQFGKACLLREGNDISLIGCGQMVAVALETAAILSQRGVDARVINMSTIKPIDAEIILEAAKETSAIVTLEEHSIIGGLGCAVTGVLAEDCPARHMRVGIRDTFGTSGTPQDLFQVFNLTPDSVAERIDKVLGI